MATTIPRKVFLKYRDIFWKAVGYTPWAEMLEAHNSEARAKAVSGGERAGKSYGTSKEMGAWIYAFAIENALHAPTDRNRITGFQRTDGLWWIVGPTYELCRSEMSYLADDLIGLGYATKNNYSTPKDGAWQLNLPFGQVVTKSAEEALKLAGVAPDGIVVCEAAQLEWFAWQRLWGRASQKRAPIWASGTVEGTNWYSELWQEWDRAKDPDFAAFSVPTWANLAVYPGGRQDPEILHLERMYGPDLFMERCAAIPCPPHTRVFPEFSELRHVVPMEWGEKLEYRVVDGQMQGIVLPRGINVQVWVDPGWAGAYAVLAVAILEDKVYIFDEVYLSRMNAREVIGVCAQQPWWPFVNTGVIDVAARQHQGMESHIEIWGAWRDEYHKNGIGLSSRYVPIAGGIERVRNFLGDYNDNYPRMFVAHTCKHTIKEMRNWRYRAVASSAATGRIINEEPIAVNDHTCKAIAYGLVSNFGNVTSVSRALFRSPFSDFTDGKHRRRKPSPLPWMLQD